MNDNTTQERLTEIIETAIKRAMAYAFDKGYVNDQKPDHERANAIRDEALAAINAEFDKAVGKDEPLNIVNGKETQRVWFIRGANDRRTMERKFWYGTINPNGDNS